MPLHRERRGVTLLELLLALAITGLAMLGGVLLLDQVDDSNRRIDAESRRDAVEANGDRLLRRLVLDARQSRDTADRFRGDERNASYHTMCDTPSGWPEPCRVALSISANADSSIVVAQTDRRERLELRRVAGQAVFLYFNPTSSGDSVWLRRWATSIALPAAIGLVTSTDTLILPLGSAHD